MPKILVTFAQEKIKYTCIYSFMQKEIKERITYKMHEFGYLDEGVGMGWKRQKELGLGTECHFSRYNFIKHTNCWNHVNVSYVQGRRQGRSERTKDRRENTKGKKDRKRKREGKGSDGKGRKCGRGKEEKRKEEGRRKNKK